MTCVLLGFVLFLVTACEDPTPPEPSSRFSLSTTSWSAPDSGGVSAPIRILGADGSATYRWHILYSVDWLTLSADSGATPGEFTVDVDANTTGTDRSADLEVVIDDAERSSETFVVRQHSRHGLIELGNYQPPHCSEALIVEADFAYMAGCNNGLIVVDISDSSHPYDYSWHASQCRERCIAKSGDYVFVTGLARGTYSLHGLVEIYDVSDPLRPLFQSQIAANYTLGAAASGNYLYLADYYSFRVYDISDPVNPDSLAVVATEGGTIAVAVYQDLLLFSEENRGVQIFDVSEPGDPGKVAEYQTSGFVSDIFVRGDYLFLACYEGGLKIVDLSQAQSPVLVGEYHSQGEVYRVFADEAFAYLAVWGSGVEILDIADLSRPVLAARYEMPSQANGVVASNGYIYAIDKTQGLLVLRFIP